MFHILAVNNKHTYTHTPLCVYVREREREHNEAPDINETGAMIAVPLCASIGNYSLTILIIWYSQFFPLCSSCV